MGPASGRTGKRRMPFRVAEGWAGASPRRARSETTVPIGTPRWAAKARAAANTSSSRVSVILILLTSRIGLEVSRRRKALGNGSLATFCFRVRVSRRGGGSGNGGRTRQVAGGGEATDRMITPEEVERVVLGGEIIEDYPTDPRGHSCLLLGFGDKALPVHVVCSPNDDYLAIITAYRPDPELWSGTSRGGFDHGMSLL